MTKRYYTAKIIFSSGFVSTYASFEEVLKPYSRNTQLINVSTNYGYCDYTKTEATLLISSKSTDKALKTLKYIVMDVEYYSGLNFCLFSSKLDATFLGKFYNDPFTGEVSYYVK